MYLFYVFDDFHIISKRLIRFFALVSKFNEQYVYDSQGFVY
jgi:hypothetical protein